MKRILRDGVYHDIQPEAGPFTLFLMCLLAFILGAAAAVFLFFSRMGFRRRFGAHYVFSYPNMTLHQAHVMVGLVALGGGMVAIAILAMWHWQYKRGLRDVPSVHEDDS